ncbi:MAG: phosphoribosyltransferase family protein [Bacillota bacterium]|jgi:adenine phosphoribosyltransferase|nr:phosphoribosyltransferase family protein [Bacillota bacterium]HHU43412.1 adenine phosphoribosyltransferase [Clostridiales bacterium]
MQKYYTVDISGKKVDLPILPIGNGINIAFFNLHGAQALTEHCARHVANLVDGAEVILTAESKGLQLAHCVARLLNHDFYAVARKSKKLYMQDGIEVTVQSITTKNIQTLYLSAHDVKLLKGKKVAIIDDVVSTGGSLLGMEELVKKAGGEVMVKAFVLAEGEAADRDDIRYLATIPLL